MASPYPVDPKTLPPLDAIECEPIRQAVEAYLTTIDLLKKTKAELLGLDPHALAEGRAALPKAAKLREAEKADARVLADSMANGSGKQPDLDKHVRQYEADLKQVRHRHDGLYLLVYDRAGDLQRALKTHPEAMNTLREQAHAARERYDLAIDVVEQTVAEMGSLDAMASFLTGRGYKTGPQTVVVTHSGGDQTAEAALSVIASLRRYGGVPEVRRRTAAGDAFAAMAASLMSPGQYENYLRNNQKVAAERAAEAGAAVAEAKLDAEDTRAERAAA